MADPKDPAPGQSPPADDSAESSGYGLQVIPAELLKLVKRELPPSKAGAKPTFVAIAPDEVFSWREYPDRVVVVTVDGGKFAAEKKRAR